MSSLICMSYLGGGVPGFHGFLRGCFSITQSSFGCASRIYSPAERSTAPPNSPYVPRCELNRLYSSTDASISDFRMETLSTLMPIGRCFSRA